LWANKHSSSVDDAGNHARHEQSPGLETRRGEWAKQQPCQHDVGGQSAPVNRARATRSSRSHKFDFRFFSNQNQLIEKYRYDSATFAVAPASHWQTRARTMWVDTDKRSNTMNFNKQPSVALGAFLI